MGLALISVTPVVLVVGLVWMVVALGLRALYGLVRRRGARLQALRHEGAPGTATILAAVRTNTRIRTVGQTSGGQRVWRMHLWIQADGIAPYDIQKGIVVQVGPTGLQPGRSWPVFVDRADHSRFLVDRQAIHASEYTVELGPRLVIQSQSGSQDGSTADARIRDLQRLRVLGLTSEEEFERQRIRIINGG